MKNTASLKKALRGIRSAVCRYCQRPGFTRLCSCPAKLVLMERNWRLDWDNAGPMAKLP